MFKNEDDVNVWIMDDGNYILIFVKVNIVVGFIKFYFVEWLGLKYELVKVK